MFDNAWHFFNSDLCITHLPSWIVMCALSRLLLALPSEYRPCAGLQVCWMAGLRLLHIPPAASVTSQNKVTVICWSEKYLQTLRHCLNKPLFLPRRCLSSKHYVQQPCHIYQLLQQPSGQRARSQHMGGIGSGANTDRHHLPNFQVIGRSRQ